MTRKEITFHPENERDSRSLINALYASGCFSKISMEEPNIEDGKKVLYKEQLMRYINSIEINERRKLVER